MSSVTFLSGLYIQTSLAVNCLPATSDRYYHKYEQKRWSGKLLTKKKDFFLHFHIWEILSHSRESSSTSVRLLDDPGGFTCMRVMPESDPEEQIFLSIPNNNDRFFFLHILWSPAFDFNVGVEIIAPKLEMMNSKNWNQTILELYKLQSWLWSMQWCCTE